MWPTSATGVSPREENTIEILQRTGSWRSGRQTMATSEATMGQTADQYGQFHPVETPELLAQKRTEFEEELKKLPDEQLLSLKQAQEKCPELLTEEFKLMFLRCEVFNADLAAKRYAHYWDKRIEILGPERAFEPLTLDKAFRDDWAAFTMGYVQLLPDARDPMGRSIIFVNPANLAIKKGQAAYDRKSVARCFWYMAHVALTENEDAQKHGIVFVGYGNDVKFSQFDRTLMKLNMASLQGAIPVRLSAMHFCRPPAFFKIVVAFVNLLVSEHIRKRLRFHFGDEEKVMANLQTFGLKPDVLPTKVGGNVEPDVVAWLTQRKSEGK